MSTIFFRIAEYLSYVLRAKGADHVHSPFLFNLYQKTIRSYKRSQKIEKIEQIRKENLRNNQLIDTIDFKNERSIQQPVGRVAKTSASQPRFSLFLMKLCEHLEVKNALECGTSLGFNSMYMASAKGLNELTTIEGSQIVTHLARENFNKIGLQNISQVNENIYTAFPTSLMKSNPELIFLDADHRGSAINFYLNQIKILSTMPRCIVIHDIYWSGDMKEKWNEIIKDSFWPLTVDVFQAGILFPQYPGPKQHFTLKF